MPPHQNHLVLFHFDEVAGKIDIDTGKSDEPNSWLQITVISDVCRIDKEPKQKIVRLNVGHQQELFNLLAERFGHHKNCLDHP